MKLVVYIAALNLSMCRCATLLSWEENGRLLLAIIIIKIIEAAVQRKSSGRDRSRCVRVGG